MKTINLKKAIISFLFVIAAGFGFTAQAQNKKQGKDRSKGQYEKLALTHAQRQEIKQINESFKAQHEAIRNNAALTDAQKKEQRMELMKKRKAEMDKILTDDQKKQMKEARKDSFKKGDHKKSGNKFRKRNSGFEDLNLSSAQTEKVKSINLAYKAKMMELKKDKAADKKAHKQAFTKVRNEHKAELKQVLTAEQIQKLEARKSPKHTK